MINQSTSQREFVARMHWINCELNSILCDIGLQCGTEELEHFRRPFSRAIGNVYRYIIVELEGSEVDLGALVQDFPSLFRDLIEESDESSSNLAENHDDSMSHSMAESIMVKVSDMIDVLESAIEDCDNNLLGERSLTIRRQLWCTIGMLVQGIARPLQRRFVGISLVAKKFATSLPRDKG